MSALISNLLRRTLDTNVSLPELRALFLGRETTSGEAVSALSDIRTLSCQPFERLEFLYSETERPRRCWSAALRCVQPRGPRLGLVLRPRRADSRSVARQRRAAPCRTSCPVERYPGDKRKAAPPQIAERIVGFTS